MWKFVIVAAVLTGLASGQSSEPEAKGFRLGGPSESAVIEKVEPAYTQDARIEGVVILSLVIDESGAPTTIVVRRSLGYGLDEKATEALEQWRFRPAMENGRPAKRAANVEMNFRLLADELPKATPEQLKDAAKLREQLAHKP